MVRAWERRVQPAYSVVKGVDKIIPVDASIRIGRDAGNTIALKDDHVSGEHARVAPLDGRVIIEDLESSEGIRVNGRKFRCCALHHGDRIEIGNTEFFFDDKGISETEAGGAGRRMGAYELIEARGRMDLGAVYRAVRLPERSNVALIVPTA